MQEEIKLGDKVVMKDGDNNDVAEVMECDVGRCYLKWWRKATEKEIAQGFRDE